MYLCTFIVQQGGHQPKLQHRYLHTIRSLLLHQSHMYIKCIYYIVLSVCLSTQMPFTDCPKHMYEPRYLQMFLLLCTMYWLQYSSPTWLRNQNSVYCWYLPHRYTLFIHIITFHTHSDHWWTTIFYLSVSISLCTLDQQYNFVCCRHRVFTPGIQWSMEECRCSRIYQYRLFESIVIESYITPGLE